MIEFLGEVHATIARLETRLRDAEERAEKAERELGAARDYASACDQEIDQLTRERDEARAELQRERHGRIVEAAEEYESKARFWGYTNPKVFPALERLIAIAKGER